MTDRHDPVLSLTGSHYPACHRFLHYSPPTASAWIRVCSPSSVAPQFQHKHAAHSRTPTQRRNPADITESLASPLLLSQRLPLALSNQRIHNRHVLHVHRCRKWSGVMGGEGGRNVRCFLCAVVGNLGVKERPQGGLKGLDGGPTGPRISPHFIAVTEQTRPTLTFASGCNSPACPVPPVWANVAEVVRFHDYGWTP